MADDARGLSKDTSLAPSQHSALFHRVVIGDWLLQEIPVSEVVVLSEEFRLLLIVSGGTNRVGHFGLIGSPPLN